MSCISCGNNRIKSVGTKSVVRFAIDTLSIVNTLNKNISIFVQNENVMSFKDTEKESISMSLLDVARKCKNKNEFIHEVSLLKESDTLDTRADRIALMTLHASKGLEFNVVFITGLENGIIPIYKAETPEQTEEERRLLYVGMTRAKQKLFLSHATKRFLYGEMANFEIKRGKRYTVTTIVVTLHREKDDDE